MTPGGVEKSLPVAFSLEVGGGKNSRCQQIGEVAGCTHSEYLMDCNCLTSTVGAVSQGNPSVRGGGPEAPAGAG